MKLEIQNLGKIEKAEIIFNGITVIAGDNNTGKSTVGKALFAFFNSLNGMKQKIRAERDGMERFTLTHILDEYIQDGELMGAVRIGRYRFIDAMEDLPSISREDLLMAIRDFFASECKYVLSDEDERFRALFHRFDVVRDVPDADIEKSLVQNFWKRIFNGQVNSLRNDSFARVTLEIRGKSFGMDFGGNSCLAINHPFDILNKAIFVHSPYVLDYVNVSPRAGSPSGWNAGEMDGSLLSILKHGKPYNAVEDVLMRQKVEGVLSELGELLPGTFVRNESGELRYKKAGYREGLPVCSLSTGLKSFAILNLLLEHMAFGEKDVLIFDEPEVNLHPSWQLKYAELIVLLQKAFDLTVLFNTHSPYFLQAIEVYSAKHGVADRCKYYFSENKGEAAEFKDVTGHTEEVYRRMLAPFEDLQRVVYGNE